MSIYTYKAKRGPTDTVEGEVEAANHQDALSRVAAMGLSPVWIRQNGEEGARGTGISVRGIRARDINIFTRQLASMIRSGVSILRALITIGEQTPNRKLRAVVGEIRESIRDGSMFSEAIERYPRLFPDLYVSLVRSGETGGILDTILVRLADARDQEEELRKKLQAAMAYPLLMLVMGVATVVVMIGFLLPRIAGLFPDLESLPAPTRILIQMSEGFSSYWYVILAGLVMLYAAVRQTSSTRRGRAALDATVMLLPIFGKFVCDADIARFSRTLSLLVRTGVPIDRALELAGQTVQNRVLREEIDVARRRTVQQGTQVAAALSEAEHFPPYVVNMIAVGEETGSLDDALEEIAVFYEREVDMMTRVVTSLMEPLLILLVGGIVGFIVFAMLLPIFELGQAVR